MAIGAAGAGLDARQTSDEARSNARRSDERACDAAGAGPDAGAAANGGGGGLEGSAAGALGAIFIASVAVAALTLQVSGHQGARQAFHVIVLFRLIS